MKQTKPNIFKLDVENRHATYDFLMNNINNTRIIVYDAFDQYIRHSCIKVDDTFKRYLLADVWVFFSSHVYGTIFYGVLPENIKLNIVDSSHLKKIVDIIEKEYIYQILPSKKHQQELLTYTIRQVLSKL